GNLRGVVGSSLNRGEVTANEAKRPKLDPKAFTFPLDVTNPDQGLGNHGHYILFFINEQKNPKISFGKKEANARGSKNVDKAKSENAIPDKVTVSKSKAGGTTHERINNKLGVDHLIEGVSKKLDWAAELDPEKGSVMSESKNSAKAVRKPTTRLDTAIALYMPPTVSVSYSTNYTDTPIGSGAANAAKILQAKTVKEGMGIAMSDELNKELVEALKKVALGTVGAIPGMEGTRELYEMEQGYIFTNRMELAFKGLKKRGFQYIFKMIPKSEKEANEVRNIVTAFKLNMLPEMKDSSIKRLKVPNTFDIKYMYVGKENEYLHKISTCVLENMNVTYGGDRYRTFESNDEGAPPVETTMTLNFKEMEQITKERAEEGF
ncbi:uncharacterized protein METZ01_LOCUS191453, partial [marine metagenome]